MTIKEVVSILQKEKLNNLPSRFPCRAIMVKTVEQYCQLLSELKKISDIRVIKTNEIFSSADVKAYYSLDCDNGIEDAVVHRSPTPEEVLEDKQLCDQLYAAVMELPDKQAKRIYARFYLDMSVKEIAQAEGVDPRRVRDSIHLGLKKLVKVFSQASE